MAVEELNYPLFQDVLEYVPTYNTIPIKNQTIVQSDLVRSIDLFCKETSQKKFIVSLSGGVDSMVLMTILHYLNYGVIGVHINYNNRCESVLEQQFLTEWCKYNGITLYTKSIENILRKNMNRTDYETLTKRMRLDLYKEVILKEQGKYVLLGHHKDDIVENVFANVCRGRNIMDLAVMKQMAVIDSIHIGRPMIHIYKQVIYEFSKLYQVPFFKDTTPCWSVRGKFRNDILPKIEDAFTTNVKENLFGLSVQSNEWNELIYASIITPFMNKMNTHAIDNKTKIEFDIEQYITYPHCFWNHVFVNLFNNHGYNSPSKKGIQTMLSAVKRNRELNDTVVHKVTLSKYCECTIHKYKVAIEFERILVCC